MGLWNVAPEVGVITGVTSTRVARVARSEPDQTGEAWPAPLVQAYADRRLALVRLAYLITGDREVGEEIVQDAFVATRRSWAQVREPGAYLRTAVVNRSRSWLRRQRLERRHAGGPPEPAVSAPDELWDALSRLNPRQRAAVVLRFYEGLPDDDIARVLGCRTATVRTAIHRALGALRQEIER